MASKKTALVLSGGGARAAFQIGAEHVLREEGRLSWDIISGVSAGALNASLLAHDRPERLREIWLSLRRRSSVFRRPGLFGFLKLFMGFRNGYYSSEPLLRLVQDEFGKDPIAEKQLRIGAVSLLSGGYRVFNERNITPERLVGSGTLPGVSLPILSEESKRNDILIDGGLRCNNPLRDVIKLNPDRVVIIHCNHGLEPITAGDILNVFQVLQRSFGIMMDEAFQNDVERYLNINELVRMTEAHNKTLLPDQEPLILTSPTGRPYKSFDTIIVSPSQPLGQAFDFSSDSILSRIRHGEEAARAALESYRGLS